MRAFGGRVEEKKLIKLHGSLLDQQSSAALLLVVLHLDDHVLVTILVLWEKALKITSQTIYYELWS